LGFHFVCLFNPVADFAVPTPNKQISTWRRTEPCLSGPGLPIAEWCC
jgi:hypothetical protein